MRTKLVVGLAVVALGMASGWAAPSLGALERALADWRLGCAGCVTRYGWDERALATFVAGRLASLGFPTELARSGETWWVLVTLEEKRVPVLPGLPPPGRDGQFTLGVFLGRIPWISTGTLDARYTAPDEVLPRPANTPPTVRIRVHPPVPQPGERVWFSVEETDPDGMVVQVWWDFGDGETSTWWSVDHAYAQEGVYTVALTVVDNRGAVATATVRVDVVRPTPLPPGGGCGCGG